MPDDSKREYDQGHYMLVNRLRVANLTMLAVETEGSMQAATINAKLHSNQDYFRQDNPYDLR